MSNYFLLIFLFKINNPMIATAITEIATRETTTISKANCISEDDDYLNFSIHL